MDDTFPPDEFSEPIPLGSDRAWIATLDSLDQYRDLAFYLVTILDGERRVSTFMAEVNACCPDAYHPLQDCLEDLRRHLHSVARNGKSNTDYVGRPRPEELPEFPTPIALSASRSWTARFEQIGFCGDQFYYTVSVQEEAAEVSRFTVRIDAHWPGDYWRHPEFRSLMQGELQQLALSGESNTDFDPEAS